MMYHAEDFELIEIVTDAYANDDGYHSPVGVDRDYAYVHNASGIITTNPEKFVDWMNWLKR